MNNTLLTKMKIKKHIDYFLGLISIPLMFSTSFAGKIYVYKDQNNGTTLLTNKKNNDQSLTTIKVTYYPESNIHQYKNWGASEAAVLPSYNKNKDAFNHIIRQAAQTHGVSEGLIKAVMHTESGFNVHARSPVGAQGLMQLMPATAKRFNVDNAYDPQQNIMAGAKYLAWLLRRFNGNTQLALAGYNAGEGNVTKYGGIPPFKETQDYVHRVTSRLNNLYAQNTSNTIYEAHNQFTQNAPTAATSHDINKNTPDRYSSRPIIIASDGTYTDAPSRSYVTQNAVASARITISDN
ncbi:transglycosylase [Acinetobacter sp. ANC 4558]|nr:transglycosylase [Acinetobacter sp. ANC 4558]